MSTHRFRFGILLGACAATVLVTPHATAQSGQESIAQTLGVAVFPSDGQTPEQQSKDEGTCYNWAVSNSGVDPFALQKKDQEQAQQATAAKQDISGAGAGAGARGALGGAAVGALVGGIADNDAGRGAAWGAAIGAVAARRRARFAQQAATQQVDAQQQQAQQISAQDMSRFKNSFSACLDAKKYMVKY